MEYFDLNVITPPANTVLPEDLPEASYGYPVADLAGGRLPALSLPAFGDGVNNYAAGQTAITREEIADIVAESLASLKVYVVESEITEAQNRVKAIVDKATF